MLLSGSATNMAASLFGIIPRELLSLRRQSEKVLKASPSAAQNAGWDCPAMLETLQNLPPLLC